MRQRFYLLKGRSQSFSLAVFGRLSLSFLSSFREGGMHHLWITGATERKTMYQSPNHRD